MPLSAVFFQVFPGAFESTFNDLGARAGRAHREKTFVNTLRTGEGARCSTLFNPRRIPLVRCLELFLPFPSSNRKTRRLGSRHIEICIDILATYIGDLHTLGPHVYLYEGAGKGLRVSIGLQNKRLALKPP